MIKKILLLASLVTSIPLTASAQKIIEVNVWTDIKPEAVVGLLVSSRGIIEKTGVEIEERSYGAWVVKVPFRSSEVSEDTLASALVHGAGGETVYGEMRPIHPKELRKSFLSLPICKKKKTKRRVVVDENIYANLANLESLLELRQVKREFMQIELRKLLSGELLQKIRRMEEGFGIADSPKLSPDMNPHLLADRLFRILKAVESVKQSREN